MATRSDDEPLQQLQHDRPRWDKDKSIVFLGDAGVECGDKVLNGPYHDDLNCDYPRWPITASGDAAGSSTSRSSSRLPVAHAELGVEQRCGCRYQYAHLKTFDTRRWMDEIGIRNTM
ncbi:MAG: hypothetical protein ACLT1W_14845 [Alistipes onderdonkii]